MTGIEGEEDRPVGLGERKTALVLRLSIIIVTWNGDDLLKNCLDSIRVVYGDVPEIVVVDNANAASTAALVAAYPNVR